MSGSKSFFLSRGVTKASFISSGKTPDERERLIILVIGVASTETRLLRREVGNGSRADDLVGSDIMREATSSVVTGLNEESKQVGRRTGSLSSVDGGSKDR